MYSAGYINYIHIYIHYRYLFLLASSIFVKSDNCFGSPGIQKIGLLSEIVELKENWISIIGPKNRVYKKEIEMFSNKASISLHQL